MKKFIAAALLTLGASAAALPTLGFADAAVSTGIGGGWGDAGGGGGWGHSRGHGWGGGWGGGHQDTSHRTIWCDRRSTGYYACGNGWSCGSYQGNRNIGCVWGK